MPAESASNDSPGRKADQGTIAWRGTYRSEPASIYVPSDWKTVQWKVPPSALGLGEGAMQLAVDPRGQVQGTVEGPLGAGFIRGYVEKGALSATLRPYLGDAGSDERGFQGTIVGKMEDSQATGLMRVSSGYADAVRVATFALTPAMATRP